MNDPMPCSECGRPHARNGHPTCSSHKRDGSPCTQWRWTGQQVCKQHGALSPQAKAAAGQRVAEAKAGQMLRQSSLLGGEEVGPVGDPVAYAQQLLGRIDHATRVLDGSVGELDVDAAWSDDRRVKVAALTQLLREARRLSVELARLGLEDRAVAVLEAQVEMHAAVLDAVLDGLFAGIVRALVDSEGAVLVVERVWPVLVGEVVSREWRALEDGRTT